MHQWIALRLTSKPAPASSFASSIRDSRPLSIGTCRIPSVSDGLSTTGSNSSRPCANGENGRSVVRIAYDPGMWKVRKVARWRLVAVLAVVLLPPALHSPTRGASTRILNSKRKSPRKTGRHHGNLSSTPWLVRNDFARRRAMPTDELRDAYIAVERLIMKVVRAATTRCTRPMARRRHWPSTRYEFVRDLGAARSTPAGADCRQLLALKRFKHPLLAPLP
jgi:hypothetical protein